MSQTECIPGNIYLHYQNGKKYVIKYICKYGSRSITTNLPTIAVYCELDAEDQELLYYRDIADFNKVITWPNSTNIWRYKYVGNIKDKNI